MASGQATGTDIKRSASRSIRQASACKLSARSSVVLERIERIRSRRVQMTDLSDCSGGNKSLVRDSAGGAYFLMRAFTNARDACSRLLIAKPNCADTSNARTRRSPWCKARSTFTGERCARAEADPFLRHRKISHNRLSHAMRISDRQKVSAMDATVRQFALRTGTSSQPASPQAPPDVERGEPKAAA